ncbi:MAG: molybdopterin converting factor subunit 1 [Chloroflexi bacterium]|nr:molybdopterin converting factor subunit 1 [Chloroflexota bacterium]
MRVRVRYFAGAREAMGRAEEMRELPAGATVGALLARLRDEEPRFARLSPDMMVSVNFEYRAPDHPLAEGDEVAVIPPVSGGAR